MEKRGGIVLGVVIAGDYINSEPRFSFLKSVFGCEDYSLQICGIGIKTFYINKNSLYSWEKIKVCDGYYDYMMIFDNITSAVVRVPEDSIPIIEKILKQKTR